MKEEAKSIQLKISLRGTDPLIWRKIIVESSITFYELHETLQTAMGWENRHLFSFRVDDYVITEMQEEFDDIGPMDLRSIDSMEITLHEALLKGGIKTFTYEYDFGDSWLHDIQVENTFSLDETLVYPICIDGKMNCPPEDCGGIPGYYHLLEVLKNKKDPDHRHLKSWIGGKYDPDFFDADTVNERLFEDSEYGVNDLDYFDENFDESLWDEFDEDWFLGPLNVKIVNKSSHSLPEYASEASAGMDLRANLEEKIVLKPLERTIVKTGLFIELPVGFEAQVRPRSGLAAKHGISVLNSPGTIDADYRGEIGVILVNLSNENFTVQNGERIAQLIIARHERVQWEEVNKLSDTDRGEGGFGSTGK